MATGPEHYRNAEQHIEFAQNALAPDLEALHLGYAQAHATLALAAATAMSVHMPDLDMEAWDAVCGVQEDEYSFDPFVPESDDQAGAGIEEAASDDVMPVLKPLTVEELRAGAEEYVAKVRAALDDEPESEA